MKQRDSWRGRGLKVIVIGAQVVGAPCGSRAIKVDADSVQSRHCATSGRKRLCSARRWWSRRPQQRRPQRRLHQRRRPHCRLPRRCRRWRRARRRSGNVSVWTSWSTESLILCQRRPACRLLRRTVPRRRLLAASPRTSRTGRTGLSAVKQCRWRRRRLRPTAATSCRDFGYNVLAPLPTSSATRCLTLSTSPQTWPMTSRTVKCSVRVWPPTFPIGWRWAHSAAAAASTRPVPSPSVPSVSTTTTTISTTTLRNTSTMSLKRQPARSISPLSSDRTSADLAARPVHRWPPPPPPPPPLPPPRRLNRRPSAQTPPTPLTPTGGGAPAPTRTCAILPSALTTRCRPHRLRGSSRRPSLSASSLQVIFRPHLPTKVFHPNSVVLMKSSFKFGFSPWEYILFHCNIFFLHLLHFLFYFIFKSDSSSIKKHSLSSKFISSRWLKCNIRIFLYRGLRHNF